MSTHNICFYGEIRKISQNYHQITEVLLMSTHNLCFYGEIRKIIPELSPDNRGATNEYPQHVFMEK